MKINPGIKILVSQFLDQGGFIPIPTMNLVKVLAGLQQRFHTFFGNKMQANQGKGLVQPTDNRGAEDQVSDGTQTK